jgi:hypothetical protein
MVCTGGPRTPSARRSREEKGKVQRSKPRRPRAWAPPTVLPNHTEGVCTRAGAAQVAQFEQQLLDDETICEVLADFAGCEGLDDYVAPELQHSIGNMDTCNVNLWEFVFRDDAWRTSALISKQHIRAGRWRGRYYLVWGVCRSGSREPIYTGVLSGLAGPC